MAKYEVIRNVGIEECHWLQQPVLQGEIVYSYHGPTYGCVGPGVAVTRSATGGVPFFELPGEVLKRIDADVLPFTKRKDKRGKERLVIDDVLVKYPGVNALTICDCGQYEFMVGLEVTPMGGNYIRCLECVSCGKQMHVPFLSVEQEDETV